MIVLLTMVIASYVSYLCISIALENANNTYSQKVSSKKFSEKKMFELGWEIEELEKLNQTGRKLLVDIRSLCVKYSAPLYGDVDENMPKCLRSFCTDLTQFIKNIVVHQREPATHIFVFMISPEERNKKPYALPIQCIPYTGIKEENIHQFVTKIVKEMHLRNMKIAGIHYS